MNAPKKRPAESNDNDADADKDHLVDTQRKRFKPDSNLELLSRLVDIADLENASQDTIQARFESIANAILCDYDLVVGSPSSTGVTTTATYQVLELEFYLWIEGTHEDPFTHGSEEQRIGGQWYFHRAPKRSADSHRSLTSLTSYRGGSRKGLDLTIARHASPPACSTSSLTSSVDNSRFFPPNPTPSDNPPASSLNLNSNQSPSVICGGILLRTLRRLPDLKVICGPSLLVDEILQASGASSIVDLVENKWNGRDAFLSPSSSSSSFLCFQPRSCPQTTSELPVYQSPRIGLDLSHPGTTPTKTHPRLLYLPKPYRFFVHPELLDKGRPQIFLGVLNGVCRELNLAIVDLGLTSNKRNKTSSGDDLRSRVTSLTSIKHSTYDKYLEDYVTGLTRGAIRTYVGTAGKGASTSPGVYLRMVGTLERFLGT
ncbi:hypothetical protein AX15_003538 [Amanita polypyramis BW_CC]|nr:hypothetical protein AX15_003538 [Amanita polypyramis BW_CC]